VEADVGFSGQGEIEENTERRATIASGEMYPE
jgi:hypothetical protein